MSNRETSTFFVPGDPIGQGSMRKGRNGQIIHSSKKLVPWRTAVAGAAQFLVRPPYVGPVGLELTFYLNRPKSVKRPLPSTKSGYDLDKLIRGCLDALTIAHVIEDDSRVCSVTASKEYAENPAKAGVNIVIYPIGDDWRPVPVPVDVPGARND